ncbi:MAG: SGNH/GDSL hydrolase family protein, partial [Polyangiales bacterium]
MKHSALLLIAALTAAASVRAEPLELDESVVDHVRQIHAIDPERHDDVFSKMGGSSVASQAFLHCFATEYVDLGERPELAETIDFFGTGRRNSFNRQSEAAGVSWNLRYVLGGRPASFREELEETGARWALVLFGGNDAQNENERVYLKRLVYLVEQLEEMGVVPILGSAMPRRNAYKDRWIHRFNLITEAVAKHWSLPYIEYHGALSALPRKGLARDGMHPNVLPPGGYKTSCQLTEEGLRYGNNLRNLLTLEMLDTLRRVTDSGADETPANASPQGEAR